MNNNTEYVKIAGFDTGAVNSDLVAIVQNLLKCDLRPDAIRLHLRSLNIPEEEIERVCKECGVKKEKEKIIEKHMEFNIVSLYSECVSCISSLRTLTEKVGSYNAIMSQEILESSMNSFPSEAVVQYSKKNTLGEFSEKNIHPAVKYLIAENIVNTFKGNVLPEVKRLVEFAESGIADKYAYAAAKLVSICENRQGHPMYAQLYQSLTEALSKDSVEDIDEAVKNVAKENEQWSPECASIVSMVEQDVIAARGRKNLKEYDNCGFSAFEMFTPILEQENGAIINIYGKNYMVSKDGKVYETKTNDRKYNAVANGLSILEYSSADDCFEAYGANGSLLKYDITKDKLYLNGKDISDNSLLEMRSIISATGVFGSQKDTDTFIEFYENRSMIARLDNMLHLRSKNNDGKFTTVIESAKGCYINLADYAHYFNELKYFKSAKEARDFIKEATGYDASKFLEKSLIAENDKAIKKQKKIQELREKRDFLLEKKSQIVSEIEKLPETADTEELESILVFLDDELKDCELKLGNAEISSEEEPDTNTVVLKLNKEVAGYPAGTEVTVDAQALSSVENDGELSAVISADNNAITITKGDLVLDIAPETPEVAETPETPEVAENPVTPETRVPEQPMINDCDD